MSGIDIDTRSEAQRRNDSLLAVMSLNRKSRRGIAKANGLGKIPARNKPFVHAVVK